MGYFSVYIDHTENTCYSKSLNHENLHLIWKGKVKGGIYQKAVLIAGGLLGFFTPIGLITGMIAQAVGLFYAKKFFKNMNEQRKITDKIERQNEN